MRSSRSPRDASHQLLDEVPTLLLQTKGRADLVFANRPFLRFTGRTLEDALGEGWLRSVHPDDRDACAQAFDDDERRRAPFQISVRLVRHDGAVRRHVVQAAPLSSGEPGYVGSAVDVRDCAIGFLPAQRVLEGLVGELREPLTVLLLAETAARRRAARADDVKATRMAELLDVEGGRLAALVDLLEDVARAGGGAPLASSEQTFDLREAVALAVREAGKGFPRPHPPPIAWKEPAEPVSARADPVRFTRVVGRIAAAMSAALPPGHVVAIETTLRDHDAAVTLAPTGPCGVWARFEEALGLARLLAECFGWSLSVERAGDRVERVVLRVPRG